MDKKAKLSFFLLIICIHFSACKRPVTQKTISEKIKKEEVTKPQLLAKDTSLLNRILLNDTQTTYLYNDTSYTLFNKDSSAWLSMFACPTPTHSFWELSNSCHINKNSEEPTKEHPLQGIKIALDPGHLAGTSEMAEIEGKQIKMKHPHIKDSVFFYEGELTYLTVSLLKESLEKLGAEVFKTRKANESAFGYTYSYWLAHHFTHDLDSCFKNNLLTIDDYDLLTQEKEKNTLLSKKIIFHKFFKHLDFYQRATIINSYQPDLTVIMHYNVDVSNKGWDKPTNKNFNMAFVPGAFMEGEIDKPIDFNNFVRLNHTKEINESIIFSSHILNGLKKHTKVDIITDYSEISYLNDYCLPTNVSGVFSRNLALTRQIKGIICYVEALYQDNIDESLLLNKKRNNSYIPTRIQDVSNGILEGIVEYLSYKNH